MRFLAVFFSFLVALAQPAAAASSPHLQSLEQQVASLVAHNSGNVGIAALDLKTGEYVAVHGDTPFPMASTVKIAVAANYLSQVEHGRRSLDDRISGRSARSLIEAMMIRSDNNATDILIRDLGGPATLQKWVEQHDIKGLRIDRNIAGLLRAKRDLWDVRDSSTPRAMVDLLYRIETGKLLRPQSRSYLLDVMARCKTGRNRMRALLPASARLQHKTGTLSNYASDVGYMTLPNGRRVAIAIFARQGTNRPNVIARTARAIYDGFTRVASTRLSTAAFGAN